jgi:putative copper resistance protein D
MEVAFGAALVGGLAVVGGEALRAGAVPPWFAIARVAAEAAALVLCIRGIPFVAPAAVLAAVLLPLGGHAAGVQPPAGAELADVLHVVSAGLWAGGILALASLHPPGGWRSAEARLLLERFAGVALIAFAVTALTGVLRATEQLSTLSELWGTSYGIVLTLKSLGVIVMLALSSLAWRRGLPVARAEAVVAAIVVGLTALLAAYPLPE